MTIDSKTPERLDSNAGLEGSRHSRLELWSFSSMSLGVCVVSIVVISRLIYFYQVAVGLAIWMITFGYIIYTIWDAFNDPIIGHLSDRNNRFTRRWGKRYPWLLFSSIPLVIVMILIFTPPDISIAGGLVTFIWFLASLIAFDGLYSAFTVNQTAQLPNKYRRIDERTSISSITIIFQTLGQVIGFILPLFFFTTPLANNPTEYFPIAVSAGVIFLVSAVAARPGLKENKQMIESYYRSEKLQRPFLTEFKENLKLAFSHKSYLILLSVSFLVTIANLLTIPMLPYFVNFVVDVADRRFYELLLWLTFILAGAMMIPVGYISCKKFGNYRIWKIALVLTGISYFGLFLANGDALLSLISVAIVSAILSIVNIAALVCLSDFFDEAALTHKKRQEGIYAGLITVISRFGRIISLVLIAVIQTITLFDAKAMVQSALAQFGVLFSLSVIPGISLILAGVLVWNYWPLTTTRVEEIKIQLKELDI